MIQKQDFESQQNKLARTICIGVIYFLLGAVACISLFALVIFLLINSTPN